MDETKSGTTRVSTTVTGRPAGQLDVVTTVDLLLLGLVRRGAAALAVVPGETESALRYEQGGASIELAALDPAFADGLVARLAIIADLDLAVEREQVGRLNVSVGAGRAVGLLLLVWRAADGLAAEVRRLASGGLSARGAAA